MDNSDSPAYGSVAANENEFLSGHEYDDATSGLTKREHFAIEAFKAIIIGNNADECSLGPGAAKDAIQAADNLLTELAK